jgi:hypothetical protein
MNNQATSALYLAGYLAWSRGDEAVSVDLLGRALKCLEGQAVSQGASSEEGDTKSDALAVDRRRSAGRHLFADCLEFLREAGPGVEPSDAFSRVDRRLADL